MIPTGKSRRSSTGCQWRTSTVEIMTTTAVNVPMTPPIKPTIADSAVTNAAICQRLAPIARRKPNSPERRDTAVAVELVSISTAANNETAVNVTSIVRTLDSTL